MLKLLTKILAFALALILSYNNMWASSQSGDPERKSSLGEGDERMVREWIGTLASDEFGGRKPMTPYEDITVNYIADQLQELGLEPAFGGSWFQPFRMIAVTAKPVGGSLSAKGKKKVDLRYPDDVVVWTARATDMVEIKSAEYVFCGFGINAPEYGWNDYEGKDRSCDGERSGLL